MSSRTHSGLFYGTWIVEATRSIIVCAILHEVGDFRAGSSSRRVDHVKIDPLAPRLIIDYVYFCGMFGPLDFAEFIALWHAADVVAQSAIEESCEMRALLELIADDAEAAEKVH